MLYLKLGIAGVVLFITFHLGVRWQQGLDAIELQQAQDQLKHLVKQADEKGIEHAEIVDQLNTQLLEKTNAITKLTVGRKCLSAAAVRVLNSPTAVVPAAASQPASAPETFATDRDVGAALAICRTEYDKLSDQLNKILDITDTR